MQEVWKDVPGYEGKYQASTEGRIKSLARIETRKDGTSNPLRERILKPCVNPNGYFFVNLCKENKVKNWRVHRLIVITFLGHCNHLEVNHKNGIKTDNRVCNLEWVSKSENGKHAHRMGLNKGVRGEHHPMAKLTMQQANEIRAKYQPFRYTLSMLSKEYGVNDTIILGIIKNRRYAIR